MRALSRAYNMSMDALITRWAKPFAGTVAKYRADVKCRQQHSEKKNKEAKDKCIKQTYLLIYHLEPQTEINF